MKTKLEPTFQNFLKAVGRWIVYAVNSVRVGEFERGMVTAFFWLGAAIPVVVMGEEGVSALMLLVGIVWMAYVCWRENERMRER